MAHSLDKLISGIISGCESRYGISVDSTNRADYRRFLRRHIIAHPEYDFELRVPHRRKLVVPYKTLSVNMLALYSIMKGETPIRVGAGGGYANGIECRIEEKRIQSAEDQHMLKPSVFGGTYDGHMEKEGRRKLLVFLRVDSRLVSLYTSFVNLRFNYGKKRPVKILMPTWGEAVRELNRDGGIMEYYAKCQENFQKGL